jgi:phage terminase Nu1 subunit (DNA packaging protein)
MSDRWISLNQLADETGLAVRTLQYIRAQEPSVLVTRQRKAMEYKQPDCAINLRKRESDKAVAEANPGDLETARTRRANADAELAEIEVAKARGDVVSVADYEAALGRILDREMARLRALPVRLAHLGTAVEDAAEKEVEQIIVEMSQYDADVIDEPIEPAKAAA